MFRLDMCCVCSGKVFQNWYTEGGSHLLGSLKTKLGILLKKIISKIYWLVVPWLIKVSQSNFASNIKGTIIQIVTNKQ